MKITISPLALAVFAVGASSGLAAADISSWRNNGNGLYPGAKAATDWSDAGRWQAHHPFPRLRRAEPCDRC